MHIYGKGLWTLSFFLPKLLSVGQHTSYLKIDAQQFGERKFRKALSIGNVLTAGPSFTFDCSLAFFLQYDPLNYGWSIGSNLILFEKLNHSMHMNSLTRSTSDLENCASASSFNQILRKIWFSPGED